MLNELFTRMQYEPSILMFGKKYRKISTSVLDYAWNAIVTTNCNLELSAIFNNGRRIVRDIIDKKDMQANIMDRKKLYVIRLFGENYPEDNIDDLDAEDITDQAGAMLTRIAEVIERNGIVLIEDFEEACFTHKELRKAFRSLYNDQKQIYIFNCKARDQYLTALENQGIAVILENSINDFFEEYISEEMEYDVKKSEKTVQLYIEAGKKATPISINKKHLLL